MTLAEIRNNKNYKEHHTALQRGYISRRKPDKDIIGVAYDGKFGKGFRFETPNHNSTRYLKVVYFVEV